MIKLLGHSGCDISLVNSNGVTLVRKISKDINYNSRLKQQCDKQRKFSHKSLLAPKIFSEGLIGDLFYFDMEYVNGLKFNDYIKIKSFDQVKSLFKDLLDFIFDNINDCCQNFDEVINDKIDSIVNTKLIDIKIVENLKIIAKKPIPMGFCHGDFTFENIIISNDKIYLIDFLDSYIDSPIIDISKILQELDLDWSNRNTHSNLTSVVKNHFLKSILLERIAKEIQDVSLVNLQRKLTLMRILPYTTNLKMKLRLLEIINKQI
jgi:thiamine kinase-like enzyme